MNAAAHARAPAPTPKAELAYMGTGPIPTGPYYLEAYFEQEREAVFRRSWLHVAHVSELPKVGDFIVRDIHMLGVSILITRGKSGQIKAFHNVCTHRGAALVWEEDGNARVFSCRYHSWTYDGDGRLIGVPDADSFFDLDKEACNLRPVALDICSGLIFINISPDGHPSLQEFLGPFYDEIASKHIEDFPGFVETRYRVPSNWKLAYDNFQEGYHIAFAHADTAFKSMASDANPFGHPTAFRAVGLHRMALFQQNPEAERTPGEAAMFGATAKGGDGSEVRGVFPNFYVDTQTPRAWTRQVWPISVSESEVVLRYYKTSPEDGDVLHRFADEYSIALLFDVEAQDMDVIAQAQRGIQSGALSHIQLQAHEFMLRHSFESIDATVREFAR